MNNNMNTLRARVCDVRREAYTVLSDGEEYPAKLKGSFYHGGGEFPTIGDYVELRFNPNGDSLIESVEERKSSFRRPDNSGHADTYAKSVREQTLAANFDYAFIIVSLNKNFNLNRIARYISVVLEGGAEPVVILTKADLCDSKESYLEEAGKLSPGLKVHAISAVSGEGMDALEMYFQPEVTIALLGSSGVGKSTLVNAVSGKELMKVSAIREEDSRGRHTTTNRKLIVLPMGTAIIDTPGIRELGMCDVSDGIEDTFSDIMELSSKCRFADCRHGSEPGCAVDAALAEGSLDPERWQLYQKLMSESEDKKRKAVDISRKRKQLNRGRRS